MKQFFIYFIFLAFSLGGFLNAQNNLSNTFALAEKIKQDPVGIEDVLAYLQISKDYEDKNVEALGKDLEAFKKKWKSSPYLKKLGKYEAAYALETKSLAELSKKKWDRAEIETIFSKLSLGTNRYDAVVFADAQLLAWGRREVCTGIIGEVVDLQQKKEKKSIDSIANAWTNHEKIFLYAYLFYKADRFKEALGLLEGVVEKVAPEMEERLFYQGVCHYRLGSYAKAETYFEAYRKKITSVSKDNNDPSYWAEYFYWLSLSAQGKSSQLIEGLYGQLETLQDERCFKLLLTTCDAKRDPRWAQVLETYEKKYPDSWSFYLLTRDFGLRGIATNDYSNGLKYLGKAYKGRQGELRWIESQLMPSNIENSNEDFAKNKILFLDYFYFRDLSNAEIKSPYFERKKYLSELAGKYATNLSNLDWEAAKNENHIYLLSNEEGKWLAQSSIDKDFPAWKDADDFPAPQDATWRRLKILAALGERDMVEDEFRVLVQPGARLSFVLSNEALRHAGLMRLYRMMGEENPFYKSEVFKVEARKKTLSYPWEFIQRAYPLFHEELVSYFCQRYAVPKYLAFALMREESHYQSSAVSSASAQGLMQIMDSTGRGLFSGAGLGAWENYKLGDPVINLHLGVRYLGFLIKLFKGDEIRAVAGYNAGQGSVLRWAPSEPEKKLLFTFLIPYDETERYVEKVFGSRQVYEAIYPQ